jgi:hypothetical protein
MQKGFSESGNGRVRDELLNDSLFFGLDHAQHAVAEWDSDHNTKRPHSPVDHTAPAEFASTNTATGADAPQDESSAAAHFAHASPTGASIAETPVAPG